MHRRQFLTALAAGATLRSIATAVDAPADLRVTRVVGFELTSQRSKVAGRNAVKEVHGDTARDVMLRVYTDAGLEGIGNCWSGEQEAATLLGQDPFATYESAENRFVSPLGAGTMPLWDLLGKAVQQPVHALLGNAGLDPVPVYDGSIYFLDLLPQYADRWEDRLREEIDMGLAIGHRAFKIKLGRGKKWMDRADGDARDADIVRIVREHGGPDLVIGVDANNGYDRAGAQRLFEQIGQHNIAFAEEMFEETVEDCLAFRDFLGAHGWETLVADGETQGNLDVFKPFIAARAIEVYQADMNRFGFEGILQESRWAAEQPGLTIAPHNWGSLVGFYMQLHVGRAIGNFYRAEHDPLTNNVLRADGYSIADGTATVPDQPGMGLEIDPDHFASNVKVRFDLHA
jgi:D-galactarolactone cycloisomerase